jgi:hypothetical protein
VKFVACRSTQLPQVSINFNSHAASNFIINPLEVTEFHRFPQDFESGSGPKRFDADISLQIQYQGISIPCSFPDRSLFRLVSKTQSFPPKHSLEGTYSGGLWPKKQNSL